MLKIHKQHLAEQDLIDIWIYSCENWGALQADNYLDAVGDALQAIARNPEIGIKIDSVISGYSKFHVKEHIIFYTTQPQRINVIRVLSHNMDCIQHL